MIKNFTLGFFLFFLSFFSSQRLDYEKLNDEISLLNNNKNYKTSIIKLEEIINDKSYSTYDKYFAYLEKSYTYKRLYNYSEALENLDLALQFGLQSDHKKEVESRILVEKLFIAFDIQDDQDVAKYIRLIQAEHLALLDAKTHAFYISILAILDVRKLDYPAADKKLDEAIAILEKASPKDLPNIYRKKVALYAMTKQSTLALDAYKKGMYYAEKYNVDIYKIIMQESLRDYYITNEDYKNALDYQKKVSDARTEYNHVNQTGQLNILEKDLLQKRKKIEIDYEKKISYFLVVLLVILLCFVFVIIKLYDSNRQKSILVQRENAMMRVELQKLTVEMDDRGDEKLNVTEFNLTDRQIEIINLVKLGKTNKEIGSQLYISENTVKYHLKIIYNVLGIENRWGLKD